MIKWSRDWSPLGRVGFAQSGEDEGRYILVFLDGHEGDWCIYRHGPDVSVQNVDDYFKGDDGINTYLRENEVRWVTGEEEARVRSAASWEVLDRSKEDVPWWRRIWSDFLLDLRGH